MIRSASLIFLTMCLAAFGRPQAQQVPPYTQLFRLSLPLTKGQRLEQLQVDSLEMFFTLAISGGNQRLEAELARQLKASGISNSLSIEKGRLVAVIHVNFPNLQASWKQEGRTLKIDFGQGRYLPPLQPPLPLVTRIPAALLNNDVLLHLEKKWIAGQFTESEAGLKELASGGTLTAEVACLLLCDVLAAQNRMTEAGQQAVACLEKAIQFSSPLRALAELKLLAYGGDLGGEESGILHSDQQYQTPELKWVGEEVLLQRARLELARGRRQEGVGLLISLLKTNPDTTLVTVARTTLKKALRQPAAQEAEPTYLLRLTEALALMDTRDGELDDLVVRAAEGLQQHGAHQLSCNLILWRMKNRREAETNGRLMTLLLDGFIAQKDVVRAQKTLAFLMRGGGVDRSRLAYYSGLVLQLAEKRSEAAQAYLEALNGVSGEEAWDRAAALCGESPMCWTRLEKHLQRLPPARRADGLLRLGREARRQQQAEFARYFFRQFLSSFPQHPRCTEAALALLLMGNRFSACPAPVEENGTAAMYARALQLAEQVQPKKESRR